MDRKTKGLSVVTNIYSKEKCQPVILIVDDRPTTRSLVRSVLEDAKYTIVEAIDGQTAIDKIDSAHPDLVLLDILMPDMDGLETLYCIRQRWDEIDLPVIMLTVSDALHNIVTTFELGATDFVSKPINFPILLARLKCHLQRKKLADQLKLMRSTLEQRVDHRTKQLTDQGKKLEHSLKELKVSEAKYSSFYNSTPSLFITLDEECRTMSINDYGANFLGFSASSLYKKPFIDLLHVNQYKKFNTFTEKLISKELLVYTCELLFHKPDNSYVWVTISGQSIKNENSKYDLLLAGLHSKEYQPSGVVSEVHSRDELTGQLNRGELIKRLGQCIDSGVRDGASHALCLLDIDQFKRLNSEVGYVAGDQYLSMLGRKLSSLLGPSDLVARIGGDEFCILLTNVDDDRARNIAQRIRSVVENLSSESIPRRTPLTASIGVTRILPGTSSVTEIMFQVDAACHEAKKRGGNSISIYREANHENGFPTDTSWVNYIRNALEHDQLELYAQEIVSTKILLNEPRYVEILIRVRRDDGTLIPSQQFVSAVESLQFAKKFDIWVIENSLKYSSQQFNTNANAPRFCINISGRSLASVEFINQVLGLFKKYIVPYERICFELTETDAIGDFDVATEFFQTMRRLGCQIALDDFGSGLSSYTYLKQLPIDFLKIDGGLVKGIDHDPVQSAIVKSIIELAHTLDKKVVAEHVENQAVRDQLIEFGADYLQGYLFNKPVPLRELFRSGD